MIPEASSLYSCVAASFFWHGEERGVTMVGRRIVAAVFLSATLGVTMARAQEPVDVLAKNGLTKSGTFFVIASEEPVMQKLYNLRPVMGQMEQKYMALAAIYHNEYEYNVLPD